MNERIRALAEQAEQYADDTVNANPTKYDRPGQVKVWREIMQEKFALLIVAECISLMKEEKGYYDNPGTYETEKYYIRMDAKAEAFDDASTIIKNRFGVEE